MADAGITDIFLPYNILGRSKLAVADPGGADSAVGHG